MPEAIRDDALAALRQRRRSLEAETGSRAWQAWNLSRERAREALRSIPER